jgi:hypothetical protein
MIDIIEEVNKFTILSGIILGYFVKIQHWTSFMQDIAQAAKYMVREK